MGDLISRQVVIDLLKKNLSKDIEEVIVTDKNIKLIESIPCAYDVEKVALELRHLAFRLPKDYCGLDGKDRAVMFDDAIDIVRKGGVE